MIAKPLTPKPRKREVIELERKLGMPLGSFEKEKSLPETQELINILNNFPWIVEVAEWGYDETLAQLILQREAIKVRIEERRREIKEDHK